jgi:SAM-dependent methyltransferase
MNKTLKKIYFKESFYPSWLLGIWINPVFIVRRGLLKGVQKISSQFIGNKLLDIGCGSKPYARLFEVDKYVGIDVKESFEGSSHKSVDKFYDGINIPFDDNEFNWVFSSEVFQQVFHLDNLFIEINRVLKHGGKLGFTCPFVWDEHESPSYDFSRYSSVGINDLLKKHGFEIESIYKSSSYIETIFQMLALYIYKHLLPGNAYFKIALTPFFVAPLNIIGGLLGKILPNNQKFYLSNIVIAVKK